MVQCWKAYLAKVHDAVAVDPWASGVQLLDVFIHDEGRRWWGARKPGITRAGSMLNLGGGPGWADTVAKAKPALAQGPPSADARMPAADGLFVVGSLADMQASVRRSSSLLSTLALSGAVSGEVDLRGSRSVQCSISGVKSHRVLVDDLMDLVTPPSSPDQPPSWKPNTSRGELQWSPKRGQTILVVIEILYASKISIESDNTNKIDGKAKVSSSVLNTKAGDVAVNLSKEATMENNGVWVVNAPKDRLFPFAFRVKQLDYDAHGNLRSYQTMLKRSNSLRSTIERASKAKLDQNLRSLSLSNKSTLLKLHTY